MIDFNKTNQIHQPLPNYEKAGIHQDVYGKKPENKPDEKDDQEAPDDERGVEPALRV